eukprot:1142942-Pelagomonas_calceolata.AAC.6
MWRSVAMLQAAHAKRTGTKHDDVCIPTLSFEMVHLQSGDLAAHIDYRSGPPMPGQKLHLACYWRVQRVYKQ